MGKGKRNKKKYAKKSQYKRFNMEDSDYLNGEDILDAEIGLVASRNYGILDTYDNDWYDRLICKRLAEGIQHRKVGIKLRR